ncbi:AMP-binding protein [Phycicoccus endophyticus]|uniref:AMP-binding protein n=1 Tax=Phycicoccus endophyticus TaxID=1690220 RepID=A0A7G9QZI7_9MICO|nr:o-succinylbenzoate--CoA ligase [Phycicoccus endophyticus]NHI19127.1 AMP-binding protein [Phycicoccus endophyticus]QNN48762.1 AMP-binding protein [Phycicoccus endophyticus]
MDLEPLPVPAGRAAVGVLERLRRALAGEGAVLPHPPDSPPPAVPEPVGALPEDLAVVVGTSGSTGSPKLALLGSQALASSARATHERLGGPGQWLLTLPAHHVAGIQVLLRSLDAGSEPVTTDLSDGFTPAAFTAAVGRLDPGLRGYTSLVPTQLVRLLADAAATRALRALQGVLVGGAATPPALRRRAEQAGVTLHLTYGMSETAGGCVYDGLPLTGARVRTDDEGRVHLGGATLAHGYLGRPELTARSFTTDPDGSRWFRTDDAGHVDDAGRLHVEGRLDDLVNTGGMKVAPRGVEEAALEHLPGVLEAVAVATPDAEWGQAVSLLLVPAPGARPLPLPEVRERLRGHLPDHALPRRVVSAPAVPLRGPGKPDRAAVAALFAVGG